MLSEYNVIRDDAVVVIHIILASVTYEDGVVGVFYGQTGYIQHPIDRKLL